MVAKKPSLTKLTKAAPVRKPKGTRQGSSVNTKLGRTSRNGRKKRYVGQGRG
jgi:hypothetical protein